MSLQTFFDNFALLLNSPNGVAKLRELILQLAIEGKLVPQNSNDKPASILIKEITKCKEELFKAKKIKRVRTAPIKVDDIAFTVPSSWNWVRLSEVYDVRDGTHDSPKYQSHGIPLVTSKNLYEGYLDLSNVHYISEEDHKKISERSKVDKSDILFAMIGSIGNPVIVETNETFSIKNVALFKYYKLNLSEPRFLHYFLKLASAEMREKSLGGVQSFVSLGFLRNYPFPLPPLEEQRRIVAKVDELMRLCDELEARQQARCTSRLRLNNATLAPLNNAALLAPVEFRQASMHLAANFSVLYDSAETVGKLRSTILQLAMQGKLVPQDPRDESALALLKKIKKELRDENKKADQGLPIQASELNFQLPAGWSVARIGELFFISSGTTPSRVKSEYFIGGTENWVKTTDLNNGVVIACEEKITVQAVKDCNLKYYPAGTVCVAMYGGAGTIGKSGILGFETTINQSVCGITPSKYYSPQFLHLYIRSIRNEWMRFAAGLRKDPNINAKIIRSMILPIPPLKEQKRIVAKVDQLMEFCAELETKLRQAEANSEKLMKAAVRDLLASARKGEIEEALSSAV